MAINVKYFTGHKLYSIQSEGSSMLPILHSGDVLGFKKLSPKQYKVNDLVAIHKGKTLFTHRIIYKTKSYFITKGDNNAQSDGKVYPKQLLGKVVSVKRNGKVFDPEQLYLIQSTLYFQEIVKLKRSFEKAGVDYVFLKGLPLHLYYEKTHPRRIYADCDVLILPQYLPLVVHILKENGYQLIRSNITSFVKSVRNKESEYSYGKTMNGFSVVFDVHTEIVFMLTQLGKLDALYPQKKIDELTAEAIELKRLVMVQGERFPILCFELLILYLALHFFHHNFRGIFRLSLLDRVIRYETKKRKGSMDKLIQKYQLENFVYPAFGLLKKYFKTPVPNKWLENTFNNEPVFDHESRGEAGVRRFLLLFTLSPLPIYQRILVFLQPSVFITIGWVLLQKVKGLFVMQLDKSNARG